MAAKSNRHTTTALLLALIAAMSAPAIAQVRSPLKDAAISPVEFAALEAESSLAASAELEASLFAAEALQPPPAAGAPANLPRSTPASAQPRSTRTSSPPPNRLASAPDMFGDFFQTGGDLNFGPNLDAIAKGLPSTFGSVSIPSAGGSRRVKIAENNKAMPQDRLIFSYNHFHNALQVNDTPFFNPLGTTARQFPIDRYTIGLEKTFFDNLWSCEVRMPFQSSFGFETADLIGAGGQIGNLAIILKRLVYETDDLAAVMGMGIDTPTGSSFTLIDSIPGIPSNQIVFRNDSLHLLPYVGFLSAGDKPYFINGFLQVDIATGGNRVDVGRLGAPAMTIGRFTEQNLLFADLGTGYWLYRDPNSQNRLTSLAALLELHYTSSLQDADSIVAAAGGRPFNYTNNFNRFDILNITTGVQAQLFNATSLRVAGVFPLGSAPDRRFFDSELQVQVNRRF
jgi:hypothetical protein